MTEPLSPDDKAFIRAILDHPDELLTWLAYADWLEDRGDRRAGFLRIEIHRRQLAPRETLPGHMILQLMLLREELDPYWLGAFDTPPVNQCGLKWRFRCPRTWDSLAPTDEPDIRICHDCHSPVFYCTTADEAKMFASAGQCVALTTRVPDSENPFRQRTGITVGSPGIL